MNKNYELNIPTEDLLEASDKLWDYAMEIEALYDRLSNSVYAIRGSGVWKGASMEALQKATENNSNQYRELTTDILNLAGLLEKYALKMEEKDLEIKQEILGKQ